MIKHRTDSKEASEFEANPDYVTKEIVKEEGQKFGIFEKKPKEETKETSKE
jgi:hypothetical protein